MTARQSHRRKILDRQSLLDTLHQRRANRESVVLCHGCFDIVHPGHVRHLEFAARQGDILVVTITGDSDIDKGDQRPYIPQELRAENLAALEFVDYVHIDAAPTAEEALEAIAPDIYIKGREYETSRDPRFLREQAIVESKGGRVIFSSGDVVFSSTELLAAMPNEEALTAERLRLVCSRNHLSRDTLEQTIDRFRGLRVAVVGDVILDRYVFCDATDVASESPMMSLNQIDEQNYIGGAAIVARHTAALGAETFFLTSAADDSQTVSVLRSLGEENVECEFLPVRPHLVEKTRYLVEEHKIVKVERAHRVPLDSLAEKQAATILEKRCQEFDAVILCDFGYGTITAGLLDRILPTIRANVPIITADVSGTRGNLRNYRNVDLLCPTERELRNTLHNFDDGLSSVAWQLAQETQIRHLICTLGKRGLVLFDRPVQDRQSPQWAQRLQSEHFPSFADRCLDRLGCGDALLATATLTLAAGGTAIQAAYLGNGASAVEIAQLGNHPICARDLLSWLKHRLELAESMELALAEC